MPNSQRVRFILPQTAVANLKKSSLKLDSPNATINVALQQKLNAILRLSPADWDNITLLDIEQQDGQAVYYWSDDAVTKIVALLKAKKIQQKKLCQFFEVEKTSDCWKQVALGTAVTDSLWMLGSILLTLLLPEANTIALFVWPFVLAIVMYPLYSILAKKQTQKNNHGLPLTDKQAKNIQQKAKSATLSVFVVIALWEVGYFFASQLALGPGATIGVAFAAIGIFSAIGIAIVNTLFSCQYRWTKDLHSDNLALCLATGLSAISWFAISLIPNAHLTASYFIAIGKTLLTFIGTSASLYYVYKWSGGRAMKSEGVSRQALSPLLHCWRTLRGQQEYAPIRLNVEAVPPQEQQPVVVVNGNGSHKNTTTPRI